MLQAALGLDLTFADVFTLTMGTVVFLATAWAHEEIHRAQAVKHGWDAKRHGTGWRVSTDKFFPAMSEIRSILLRPVPITLLGVLVSMLLFTQYEWWAFPVGLLLGVGLCWHDILEYRRKLAERGHVQAWFANNM